MKRLIPKRTLRLSQVYRLLEPGPVTLLTTAHAGRPNIMAMSWHTMMEFEPPLVGCVISNRNYSFETLYASKECVINIPSVDIVDQVIACGNHSGRKTDKFRACDLTPVPASCIAAPLIAECFANLECRVSDTKLVEKYCFFILEVLKCWIAKDKRNYRTLHHRGRGEFMFAGKTVKLPSKAK